MTAPNTITAHWEQSQLATDQVLQMVHTGHKIFLVLSIMWESKQVVWGEREVPKSMSKLHHSKSHRGFFLGQSAASGWISLGTEQGAWECTDSDCTCPSLRDKQGWISPSTCYS